MRMVSLDNLGAWLLKCNGTTSDIVDVAARRAPIRQWCVQPSYRTALMAAGQPFLFWVSGERRLAPGVWALGELSGPPAFDEGEHPKLRVPLNLRWLDERSRIPRDVLRADDRLTDLEVLRQPQAANPSFVTRTQLAALRTHLPDQPRRPKKPVGSPATSTSNGSGFGPAGPHRRGSADGVPG